MSGCVIHGSFGSQAISAARSFAPGKALEMTIRSAREFYPVTFLPVILIKEANP